MEQVKMKRDEVVHEIEEDLEVVQTIEKGEGQVIEDIDDDEVGRETEGDGEVEIEEGKLTNFIQNKSEIVKSPVLSFPSDVALVRIKDTPTFLAEQRKRIFTLTAFLEASRTNLM